MTALSPPVTILFIPLATVDREVYHQALVQALQQRLAALAGSGHWGGSGWQGQLVVLRSEEVAFFTLAALLDRVPVYSVIALDNDATERLRLAQVITKTLPDSTVILTSAETKAPVALAGRWHYQPVVQTPATAAAVIREVFDYIIQTRIAIGTTH